MAVDQEFDQCVQLFFSRDYEGCVQRVIPMLETGVGHELLQMLLISLQRLDQTEAVEELGPRILAATEGEPWIQRLVKLTLGQGNPEQLRDQLGSEKNEEQCCQAAYYWGARLLTDGETGDADKAFTACLEGTATCVEKHLAQLECLSTLHQQPFEVMMGRTKHLLLRINDRNQYGKANQLLRQVLQQAESRFAESRLDPEHSSAWLRLFLKDTSSTDRESPKVYRIPTVAAILDESIQLTQQCQYNEALSLARQALKLAEKHLDPCYLETARILNHLGTVLQEMGDLREARSCYERSLSIRQTIFGSEHQDTARVLNNLGCLLKNIGEFSEARPCLERALNIYEKVLGPEHPNTAASLTNLGGLLLYMEDLSGAQACYLRALNIREKAQGAEHPDTAGCLNSLGVLLVEMGRYSKALPYYQGALSIREKTLGTDHPETAISLANLGVLLEHLGDLSGARSCLERALTIREKVLGSEHPDTGHTIHNMGTLLHRMGDLSGARANCERALSILKKSLGDEHRDIAICLNGLAELSVHLDQATDALALMRQAAAIDDRITGQMFSAGSEKQRSAFLKRTQGNIYRFLSLVSGHLAHSSDAVSAGIDIVLRRKAISAEALAAQRDAVLGGKYPDLADSLHRMADVRRQMARKTLAGPGREGLQAHQQQLEEWTAEKEALETKLARQIPEMNLAKKLQQADRRAVALALDAGVSLVEFVRFHVYDFKAVPARGEPHWHPARYLAFVLPFGQPDNVQMIDLGEAAQIDRLIADFRSSIIGEAETRTGRNMVKQRPEPAAALRTKTGTQLRAAVFDSLAPALAGCRRLLLAPDGALTRLPFEVLPDADGRLLIDDYQISYLGAGRDVLRFGAETTGQPTDSLVVADPDFDLDTETAARQSAPPQPKLGFWSRLFGRKPTAPTPPPVSTTVAEAPGRRSRDFDSGEYHFDRLPGTRGEGERIAALLGVQPWLGHTALEGRLKQKCCSPRILHLATHGFFLQDQPRDPNSDRRDLGLMGGPIEGRLSGPLPENPLLRAGLALAGANTWLKQGALPPEAEDGLLTAEDVSGMDLLATELVVLSACETGLGEVRTGEGVFGLQRAFVLAGAKTLVMSLWSVPDEPTRELMEDFYQRILRGEPRADALRAAQMKLRVKYPDPYYWGALICQGDPGPLREWKDQ